MASIIAEGRVCACCASLIANGDDSGCRDHYGHTEIDHPMTGFLAADEMAGWVVMAGCDCEDWQSCDGHDEIACGSCDYCGADHGYFEALPVAVIK